ncbi:hypothetical protein AALA13_18265 [Lachnospiraceae bacterium 50-23]|jgi:hypothetical protein|uniref:hypothetical protein n=1 Tax=Paraclostridium dentum TaxID=2662455 RepID=UPI002914D7A0|nr:hypothetical protein [Klebsiella oxytoca]
MYINNLFNKKNDFIFNNANKKNKILSLSKNDENIVSYTRNDKDILTLSKGVNIVEYINLRKVTSKMIENRGLIDFSDGIVSFEYSTNKFYIDDNGVMTEIPISNVSPFIDPDNIKTLKIYDNKLILTSNSYYKFNHSDGIERIYGATNKGFRTICFVDNIYNNQDFSFDEVLFNTSDIINNLVTNEDYINGSKKFNAFLINELGFKPGVLEVGLTTNKIYKYFYKDNGSIFNEKTFNERIDSINLKNHIKYGVPKDAKWIIGGNEYHMNEDGYFNIPYLSDTIYSSGEFKLVNSEGQEIFLMNPDMVKL